MIVGTADGRKLFEEVLILDVDESRGHLGALERPADAKKLPAFVVGHGCVGNPVEAMRAELDFVAKAVRAGGNFVARIETRHVVVEAVDVFPHFAGNAVANGAGVLARLGDALDDGTGIVLAEGKKIEDVFGIGFVVTLAKTALFTGHDDQGLPAQTVGLGLFEEHVVVHVENTSGVFGAFDITGQPEERFRDAGKHYSSPRKTQVSLLPPPWEEFTTREPRCSATRVNP